MGKYESPKRRRRSGKGKGIALVLCLVLAAVTVIMACFGTMDQSKRGLARLFSVFSFSVKETKEEVLGLDAARYQGTIDWEQVADAGIDFAMIRLGYRTQVDGEIVEDSNARYNLQEASRNGILVGAYFFSTAITPEEAQEEAAWVADLLAPYPITYPVAYNCEGFLDPENRNHSLTAAQRTSIATAFLTSIEDYGYEGMFYASKNEMEGDAHWLASQLEQSWKIWVAHYPEQPYPETQQSDYSGKHQMWQYTALGTLPGVSQNVDLDVAYFSYNKAKAPKDSTSPEEAFPDVEALMNFRSVQETVTAKEETNLRSLPSQGPESQVLYTLRNGETADRIGVSDNGWSKLQFQGQIYYAVSNFLTTDMDYEAGDPDGDGFETVFTEVDREEVTPKDTVNLRTMPSVTDEESKVIVKLKKGETAVRTGISDNGWSRLEYKGQTCYAVTSYLVGPHGPEDDTASEQIHTRFESVNDTVTPKDAVNLRTRPTVQEGESEVIAKVHHGEKLERTGVNRDVGWSRVVYQDQTLYCITKYLQKISD